MLSSNALCNYFIQEYFPHSTIACRLFYRGLHDIYKVTHKNDIYFFKVYRQGLRSIEEIQSEVDLLNHLRASGIEVVNPIIKQDETFIGQFKTVNGIRYGVLYKSVGIQKLEEMVETAKINEKLGSYIASIHNAWDKLDFNINKYDINSHSFIDNSMSAIRQFNS